MLYFCAGEGRGRVDSGVKGWANTQEMWSKLA